MIETAEKILLFIYYRPSSKKECVLHFLRENVKVNLYQFVQGVEMIKKDQKDHKRPQNISKDHERLHKITKDHEDQSVPTP